MSEGPVRVHVPVLLEPVLRHLAPEPETLEGWVVDGTVGAAGHASALLERAPGVRVLGVDQDPELVTVARRNLERFGERARVVRGRFSQLDAILDEAAIGRPVGMLFDLGVNSLHLDRPDRGFSFRADGPLDMRMDPTRDRTAADIVNSWDEEDLADLLFHEGGERGSRKIARAICEARRRVPFQRTAALADLIAFTLGSRGDARIHPATRSFQALRRAVNEEGEELIAALDHAEQALEHGGRLVVLTFHEGEDKCVGRELSERARTGLWQLVNKKPLGPDSTERRTNPRARSALLRCAERLRSATTSPKEGGR